MIARLVLILLVSMNACAIEIAAGKTRVLVDESNGAIALPSLIQSGEAGLWRIRFSDNSTLDAASVQREQFALDKSTRGALRLTYDLPEAKVIVSISATGNSIEMSGQVTPRNKTVLDLDLPARLRFDPEQITRFVTPLHGHLGMGAALNPEFFNIQPENRPSGAVGKDRFLRYSSAYPPAFADFQHIDGKEGSVSVYRVQRRNWQPWQGATDPNAIFVPGRIGCGGDAKGGYADRSFGTFIKPGQTWSSPIVRIIAGQSADQDLREYATANGITRTLEQKLSPALFDKFKNAVLVKYDGTAREQLAHLGQLPVPTLIHFSEYLHGGFDKQYPDHLPPNPKYATPEEFAQFLAQARAKGHLTMPYTNPTWWCDHPKGPTFEAAGDGGVARNLEGKPLHEKYGDNDGWTITFWHPDVRKANDNTLRQFTRDYPVDILFQDQCGARTWMYDTNPASPAPFAYHEGLLSMTDEQSRAIPLSTEDAFDRVIDSQVQVCGLTFALVPGRVPPWVRLMRNQYHPSVWQVYPVAQIIAHDKVAFLHHDLGKFVTDRSTLSWSLALGMSMSERLAARLLDEPKRMQWLLWLDRVQKSICARYVGQPVGRFAHQRFPDAAEDDDGVIDATWGDVRVIANLGPKPREVEKHTLAGHGFFVTGPGLMGGNVQPVDGIDHGPEGLSYIAQRSADGMELWVYSPGDREVVIALPDGSPALATLMFDHQTPVKIDHTPGQPIRIHLPGKSVPQAYLWHASLK